MIVVMTSKSTLNGESRHLSQVSRLPPPSLTDRQITVGMENLFDVFEQVDDYYNNQGGITPQQAIDLGIWNDNSQIVVHGPFQYLPNNAQIGPGSVASQGTIQCANLQSFFDGQLKVAYPNSTRQHNKPIVTDVFRETRTVTVNTSAKVFDSNGVLVAVEKGLANYHIPFDNSVPVHIFIHFTIEAPLFFQY